MSANLNEFFQETFDRYYHRLTNLYEKRMNNANDKAYTHEEFSRYCGALLAFRYEDSSRTFIVKHFDHDYKVGKDFNLSISKLRKNFEPVAESSVPDFWEIDAQGNKIENDHQESFMTEIFDLSKCSDINLIRMFAEYKAYKRFGEYLDAEKVKLANTEVVIGKSEAAEEIVSAEKKEFTTARQVLAVHYLLKYANVKNVDKTEIARFIQFLTGKNIDNIYKRLQNLYKINDKALKEDLRYVRKHFEYLNLSEIVKMINNEIDS